MPFSEAVDSRVILTRLRDTLAEPGGGQERLDRIVKLIACGLVAEVCSIYLRRDDQTLELCATQGLKPEAVHQTRLRVGQGLVGRIAESAEPINTTNAPATRGFRFMPETGEEIYSSFLGVPVQRLGEVLGVLVVQNQQAREYTDDEIYALEVVAMVIAEMAELGAFVGPGAMELARPHKLPFFVKGLVGQDGVAEGVVLLHEPQVLVINPISDDPARECARLRAAIEALRAEVDQMLAADYLTATGEHRDVLQAYRMFAHDKGWVRRMEDSIESGLAAEVAVEKEQSATRARMSRVSDPYLRERLHDLDDLSNRLLRLLAGVDANNGREIPENAVLVARNIGPAELLDYGRNLRGVVLEEGSVGSHAAIVARALAIPLVIHAARITREAHERRCDPGRRRPRIVHLRPEEIRRPGLSRKGRDARRGAAGLRRAARQARHQPRRRHAAPAYERGPDGRPAEPAEMRRGRRRPVSHRIAVPDPRHRAEAHRPGRALRAHPRFRRRKTRGVPHPRHRLGQGAALHEAPRRAEPGARLAGDPRRARPARHHAHAGPGAAARRARAALAGDVPLRRRDGRVRGGARTRCCARWRANRRWATPCPPACGSARCWRRRASPSRPTGSSSSTDFVSIGGNDLKQFFFAADRENELVRRRYDMLSSSFLGFLEQIVARCAGHGTPLSFCGEDAGRPLEALALAAIGLRSLSMRPASIGPVKALLRQVDLGRGPRGDRRRPRRGHAPPAALGLARSVAARARPARRSTTRLLPTRCSGAAALHGLRSFGGKAARGRSAAAPVPARHHARTSRTPLNAPGIRARASSRSGLVGGG